MDPIAVIWDRIETWLQGHAPAIVQRLPPGVTEEALRQAEATMGLTLPEAVKASYRRHNGAPPGSFLLGQSIFYDLTGMVHGQQRLAQRYADLLAKAPRTPQALAGPIQPVWWHPAWLPVTGDGAGNHWCLDLAPASGGQVGQIIDFDHEVGPTKVLATSFQELLSTFADQLEAGVYMARDLNLIKPEWIIEATEARRLHINIGRVSERSISSMPTISRRASIPTNELVSATNTLYREVRAYLEQQGIQPLQAYALTAFARYTEEPNDQITLEVGIAIVEARPASDPMISGTLSGGTVAALPCLASRETIPEGFRTLEAWGKHQQKTFDGQPWVIYLINPRDPQAVPYPGDSARFEVRQLLTP